MQAAWTLEEVNSLRPSFAVGAIPPATAVTIGISNAVDHMMVLHIPWDGPYPAQLLITAAGRKEMYLRHCINGTWDKPQKVLTNADSFIKLPTDINKFAGIHNVDGEASVVLQWDQNGGLQLVKIVNGITTNIKTLSSGW